MAEGEASGMVPRQVARQPTAQQQQWTAVAVTEIVVKVEVPDYFLCNSTNLLIFAM